MRGTCISFLATAPLLVPLAVSGADATQGKQYEDFDPTNFDRPTVIDNPWLPLVPGKRFIYEGTSVDDEGDKLKHRVEIHVTDLIKPIDGVRTRVTWDLDYEDGELVEAEVAFFAQDNDGRVWRMGEHPEEYEDGELVDAPTWIAGIDGARPGIEMLAKPRMGTPSYSQGWAPAIRFTDRGQVDQTGASVRVPYGSYEDVLVVAETSEDEGPNAAQLKYFARGVGNVKVGWRGEGEKTQEMLELIGVEQLDGKALEEVHGKALALEKSAYKISPHVYAKSQPIEGHELAAVSAGPSEVASAAGDAETRPKISEDAARKIALEAVPGEITDFAIERKLGENRYVVEVVAESDGSETDVIIDMYTGEVLATEN